MHGAIHEVEERDDNGLDEPDVTVRQIGARDVQPASARGERGTSQCAAQWVVGSRGNQANMSMSTLKTAKKLRNSVVASLKGMPKVEIKPRV